MDLDLRERAGASVCRMGRESRADFQVEAMPEVLEEARMSDPTERSLLDEGIGEPHAEVCTTCQNEKFWRECYNCEDGFSDHDCGEDCCCCLEH